MIGEIRELVRYPAKGLTHPTHRVSWPLDEVATSLVEDMVTTLHSLDAYGIAANQVGGELRLCVLSPQICGLKESAPPVTLVNPEIVWTSDELEEAEEGCLSLPGISLKVKRPKGIKVSVIGDGGEPMEFEDWGIFARVVQHECDHLNGKLIWDRVSPTQRELARKKHLRLTSAGVVAARAR